MLYLKKLNNIDTEKEYQFFKTIKSENGFINDYENVSYDEFIKICIPERISSEKGIDLKPGFVPDTYYFLWLDSQIIGLYRIRHYLNDNLRNGAGHIGYGILPQYRNQGYGTQGLALAIEKCKDLLPSTEKEIYMSCNLTNKASLAIMLKNNAYIHHQDDQHFYTRIKIK